MDYIPVYEGDDSDDGSVKLSPGKIQRTGVKSEPAARRVIRTTIRAPGTIQLDERRISVIAMRAESFVQKVADVTTGTHVVKGQPLDGNLQSRRSRRRPPNTSRRSIPRPPAATGPYGRGSRQRLMNLDVPDAAIVAMEKSRNVPIGIEWTSPRDGIVLERNAIEGMRAQPGDVPVPDRRSFAGVGDRSMSPNAIWGASPSANGDSARAELSRAGILGKDQRHLSGDQQGDANRARARRIAQSGTAAAPRHVCRCRDRHRQRAIRCWRFPKAPCMDTGSRQAVFVDKGEGPFRAARGQARPSRRGLCRGPRRASPTASRWSSRPIS